MEDTGKVIPITVKEHLPDDTDVYVGEDGTKFYWKHSTPKRMYVKIENEELEADLPTDEMFDYSCYGVHENAVYLCNGELVHIITFEPPYDLDVCFERHISQAEQYHHGVLCSQVVDGKTHIYRLFQDFRENGIIIDASTESLEDKDLLALHRGKAIYRGFRAEETPSVRKLSENVFVLDASQQIFSIFARDSSSFVYFECDPYVYTLNTQTLELLPALKFENIVINSIVDVRDGVIMINGCKDQEEDVEEEKDENEETNEEEGGNFLFTAQLPDEYFEKTTLGSTKEESNELGVEPEKKKRKHSRND